MNIITCVFTSKNEGLQNFLHQCTLDNNICKPEWQDSLLVFTMSKIQEETGTELAALISVPATWADLHKFLVKKYEEL